jgi:phosphomevalonate kinase
MKPHRGRASAPGKVVLSGSYSVLEGAPAIVAAVDRYVIADASRRSEIVTAEVRAAINGGGLDFAPWFDASALRVTDPDGSSRKLGIGSSAAILAASLAACSPEGASRDDLFEKALDAHRSAQGGGSGIDVAASIFGGILLCLLDKTSGRLDVRPHS